MPLMFRVALKEIYDFCYFTISKFSVGDTEGNYPMILTVNLEDGVNL